MEFYRRILDYRLFINSVVFLCVNQESIYSYCKGGCKTLVFSLFCDCSLPWSEEDVIMTDVKSSSKESGFSVTEDKVGNKNRVPAWSLTDSELLERILAGDKKLLGDFLMGVCASRFTKLAKKFFSLKLDPREVASIACIHLLKNNMSVLRSYKPGYFGVKKDATSAEESNPACSQHGLSGYVEMVTARRLSKLLSKHTEQVGSGIDKAWSINHQADSSESREKRSDEKKVVVMQVSTGRSLDLDSIDTHDIEKNVNDLLSEFHYSAVDLNALIAKLPILEQKVYICCSLYGWRAKKAGSALGLDVVTVYAKHASAKELLNSMKK